VPGICGRVGHFAVQFQQVGELDKRLQRVT
jgi:hypothetical protein